MAQWKSLSCLFIKFNSDCACVCVCVCVFEGRQGLKLLLQLPASRLLCCSLSAPVICGEISKGFCLQISPRRKFHFEAVEKR